MPRSRQPSAHDVGASAGAVIDGIEVGPLLALATPLRSLVAELEEASDAVYLHDPRWVTIVDAAETARAAMARVR